MIKEQPNIFTMGGSVQEIKCDSCYTKIETCTDFIFERNQELIYCPILCESCGTESSKFMGETLKELEELQKKKLKVGTDTK